MKKIYIIIRILPNFVPFFGVLFWNWSIFSILFIYWIENLVVGLFNFIRILKEQKRPDFVENKINKFYFFRRETFFIENQTSGKGRRASNDFLIIFLSFMFVHGFAIFAIFGKPAEWQIASYLIPAVSFIVSYGILYFNIFEKQDEGSAFPFSNHFFLRLLILQFVVILGGYLTKSFGAPQLAILFLTILKTIIDIFLSKGKQAKTLITEA